MLEPRHSWTYEENEYCVDEVFKNFVIGTEYDYDAVINKLYIRLDGKIKKPSIRMKLQNIKYLLNEYNISNTLTIAPLSQFAQNNADAFLSVAKKYNKLIK